MNVTLPRLELLACLIGARLLNKVLKAIGNSLPMNKCYFWTDSLICCGWIKRDRNWKQFVANRVVEIRTLSNSNNWSHVPGCENPADLVSRGTSLTKLAKSKLWKQGPSWLLGSSWPNLKDELSHDPAFDEELSKEEKKAQPSLEIASCVMSEVPRYWNPDNFSSWTRLSSHSLDQTIRQQLSVK